MREKLLQNERYGAIEIDKNGVLTGVNNHAHNLLSELPINNTGSSLKGENISKFAEAGGTFTYDHTAPEKIISSIDGIKPVDNIFYTETESVIIRFVKNDEVFTPFFDMMKSGSSLYLELDTDLNIILASDSFCKAAGLSKSEIFGKNISVITDSNGIGKISSAGDIFRNNIIDNLKIDEIQFSLHGASCSYDMEVSPINDRRGMYTGIFCHFADNFYEKKCRKMGLSLRRMSAIANFAGGIAHDYNNALTAVLGNISLAKMDAEKNSELEELLRDAESAGIKIKILTERLAMFARGMKPAKEKTDLKKAIENIIPEIFALYKGRYKLNLQSNMVQPEIDQEMICEAIRHVIENALDASDRPDGEIIIEAKEEEINKELIFRETSLVSGKYITITVTDNGPGLDQSAYGDIFDPYVTTKSGREGLGLALTYTILKRHRGFISVESPEQGGAYFKIYIPIF